MPTSSYMPSITCHIAFDGGFRVPMADWTWTDVSDYVELEPGIGGTWGRGDERSTADANTLTLTLDNSDGRFTAGRVTGAYYPDVKLYKPIKVTFDPVDGAALPGFTGYITSWPVEWDGTAAYAKATITAASRLSRVGLNAEWRSLVEETFLYDSPVAYYPLGEAEGATLAADVSGNGAAPLALVGDASLPVVFGQATGPGTDGLTAATFAGGQYLSVVGPEVASGAWSIACYFSTSEVATRVILGTGRFVAGVAEFAQIQVGSSGELIATMTSATDSAYITGATVSDGATHHVALTVSAAGAVTLYLDGVSVGTDTCTGTPQVHGLRVGFDTILQGVGFAWTTGHPTLTGVVAHAAVFDTELSSTRVAAQADAGSDGWAGDLTDTRLERYAELAGIPSAEVAAEVGTVTMVHVDTTGQSIVDLLRACETTEGGVLFDALDGTLTMHNRSHRYDIAASFTLDMAQDHVEADYQPRLDSTALVNDATVTSAVTTARKVDTTSRDANGVATSSVSIHDEDPDAPAYRAAWMIHKYADPKTRVPSLTVDALAQVGKTPNCAAILNATVGDKISVANHPGQAAYSIVDYFIEGGSFDIGPERFRVTWNLSPSSPEDTVLILDSPSRGLLDTNVLAF